MGTSQLAFFVDGKREFFRGALSLSHIVDGRFRFVGLVVMMRVCLMEIGVCLMVCIVCMKGW